MVKNKNKSFASIASKLASGKLSNKEIFKKSKLAVEINIPKGHNLLNQKSAFFKDEYAKEKNLLSWS